jgi:hypothetical protein
MTHRGGACLREAASAKAGRVRREIDNKSSVKRIRHEKLALFVDSPAGCIWIGIDF